MSKIELKGLSLKELKSLKLRVEKAIERQDKKAKAEALSVVKAKAKEMGFSLAELTGDAIDAAKKASKPKKAKSPRKAAKVAYRDTNNSANTWAGRGPRPKWLKDALASGKTLESFKV